MTKGPGTGRVRSPHFRLSVRLLCLAVAAAGLAMGSAVEYRRLARRAAVCRARAEEHAGVEQTLRMIMRQSGPDSPIDISPGPGQRSKRFTAEAVAEFEAGLARKYERAARYPWLAVEPDPLMPSR